MSDFKIKDGIAIIPEGTTKIKVSAFAGCTSLESVVIPVGVTEIGEHAFKDCTSLTTVILPFSVNKIGKDTFKECSALTTIYVPADKVDHYKSLLPGSLHGKIASAGDMKWDEAIREVLADNGAPMRLVEILKKIIEHGYRLEYGDTPVNSVGTILRINEKRWFECVERGVYKLVDTSVTDEIDWDEIDWDDDDKKDDDPNYKKASDFITSTDSAILSEEVKELLELIVNFRLPLVNRVVCFADILDDLEVEFSPEEKIRPQSIDADLLRRKLDEIKNNAQSDSKLRELYSMLLNYIGSANYEDKVDVPIRPFGEFIPGSNPKVVIYYKNIISILRWRVMAGVFVHEMFHAWNYFKAGQKSSSVLAMAIDEPMVEFETLYFLKELAAFTSSQSHSLKGEVERVYKDREYRVRNKQWSIGDVAAYGFGYYLFEKLGKSDVESIEWIETYSKKSASIKNSNKEVKKVVEKVEYALIPVYPFMSEADVMKWFKEIIFAQQATSKIVGKSTTATKVGLPVSLRDLVLACIKAIGRKYFEAKELYAFAPIFEVCVAVPGNLEDTLKQQLDELVKDGVLEVLSDGCYSRKLAGVEDKPISKVKTPAKSKGGYTRGSSIPFAVEFPDGVIFDDNKAVKTFIKSLQKIGLSNVQHVGIMIQGYNLVSDVERPSDGKNKWQDYVDNKYIYTKLANSSKIKYLYQIANELGISIKIYDI